MKLISVIAISILLISCSSKMNTKKDKTEAKSSQTEYNTKYKFDLSLHTKLFLQDLKKELAEKEITEFEPSSKLKTKYSITENGGEYRISGFIKTNNQYNKADLVALEININSSVGNIITVSIPLKSIYKFLELDGIKYFEISKKVEFKNQ